MKGQNYAGILLYVILILLLHKKWLLHYLIYLILVNTVVYKYLLVYIYIISV